MEWLRNGLLRNRLYLIQLMTSGIIISVVWLNEILDLPYYFGAEKTPVNITESIIETILIIIATAISLFMSAKLLSHLKYVEGFLPVCSFCRKIRVSDTWLPLEEYVHYHTDAEITHSLCPDCIKKNYPEFAHKIVKNPDRP